jgi:hypothetical protein
VFDIAYIIFEQDGRRLCYGQKYRSIRSYRKQVFFNLGKSFVVGNLIRFINQFWYIGDDVELNNLISKENIQSVASKIKKYQSLEVITVNLENSR